jgi:predicted nucleotidyltransferase
VYDRVVATLRSDERILYALAFGSAARGQMRPDSDLDIALALNAPLDTDALGRLVAELEAAAGRAVDVVLISEAPPGLAYRVFRDGQLLVQRDRDAFVRDKKRAILAYLDFQPIEKRCADGVLRAAAGD